MPAPVLTAGNLGDLLQTTLPALPKGDFTEIATDLQEHTAMQQLLPAHKMVEQSGHKVQWSVMASHSNSARNAGLASSDIVNIVDTMTQASADWKFTTSSWAMIDQEVDMNREPARIIDLIKERRIAARISVAEIMETNFWGPPVGVTDTETPWGVNTWIVKNATEGFNGGAPSGYTTIGLNPTTYPRWKNWTYQYTNVTKDDLIRHLRTAATKCNFKPPVSGIPSPTTPVKWGFYTTYSVVQSLEEVLESQNENLGVAIDPHDGDTLFRKTKIQWVPKLDADTTNPFYGINWNAFKVHVLKGWWGKETVVHPYPGQHNTAATFEDYYYQMICKNRRSCFVAATGTSYPS